MRVFLMQQIWPWEHTVTLFSRKKSTCERASQGKCYDVPLWTPRLITTSLLYEIAPDLIWGLPYAHCSLPFRLVLFHRDLYPF
jgi:hypothetical protein